jgi:hypothetical protein
MAIIPRDASHPLDLADATQLGEYEGFAADVPGTDGLIAAAANDPAATPANLRRAARMFSPDFLANVLAPLNGVVDAAFPTPDAVAPNVILERQGIHDVVLPVPGLPGGVPVWGFDDGSDTGAWPAPPIRVREGQIVHSTLNSRVGPHVIHHHGIEPTPINDGVGHLTMDVAGGAYTYQWLAGESGTYFYHCHVNTVLHFERGMYGALIIDPNVAGAPFALGGPGAVHVGDDVVGYDAEAVWVVDDMDTRWHGLAGNGVPVIGNRDVAVGVQAQLAPGAVDDRPTFTVINDPDNPRLHDFRPNVFLCTGVAAPFGVDNAVIEGTPGSAVTPALKRGGRLLVRTLNASYAHTRWEFPTAFPGQVIAADGRTFGRAPFGSYSSPFTLASLDHKFQLSVARRWNILLDIPANADIGIYEVKCTFFHWVTDLPLRSIRMRILVIP